MGARDRGRPRLQGRLRGQATLAPDEQVSTRRLSKEVSFFSEPAVRDDILVPTGLKHSHL